MTLAGFDPLPQGTGKITGFIRKDFIGFIRDDTTKRELIFRQREVVPAEAWESLAVGDRVQYYIEPDYRQPGRFMAVEVSRLDTTANKTTLTPGDTPQKDGHLPGAIVG